MDEWVYLLIGGVIGGIIVFLLLGRLGSQPPMTLASPKPIVSNTEKWEWIDYKGRKRYILVTREVH